MHLKEDADSPGNLQTAAASSYFIQRLPRSVLVSKGNTAELPCSVAPDNAKVNWFIDGIPIYESDKYKIKVDGPKRKLLIHHSNKVDEGLVTAATEHDDTSAEFYVEGVLFFEICFTAFSFNVLKTLITINKF